MRRKSRQIPPPLPFDLNTLPGSAVLSAREAAAALRCSVTRLETWREQQPNHPLRWRRVSKRIVYEVSPLREFLKGEP